MEIFKDPDKKVVTDRTVNLGNEIYEETEEIKFDESILKKTEEFLESAKDGIPMSIGRSSNARSIFKSWGFTEEEIFKNTPNDLINNLNNKYESYKKTERQVKEESIHKDQGEVIEQKFKEFNIQKEDLSQIEDFDKLSYGQQLLVLENLEQLTLGRVQEEAFTGYKKEVGESKFLGKVWKNITKKYQIGKKEKEVAGDLREGGFEIHKETLKQLVDGMKNFGVEVDVSEEGILEIQYASGFTDLNDEEKGRVREFNILATKFSRMPAEWGYETATKDQQEKYKELKEVVDYKMAEITSLRTMDELKKEEYSDDYNPTKYMYDLDSKISLNQFLNTHPDAEQELQKIESEQVWTKAFKNIATERGLYFGAGFATRSVTTSLLGVVGLPIAASFTGGWIARRRAKETLREREVLARKGDKDASKEAKNIIDADNLTKKINSLLDKINSVKNQEERKRFLRQLAARVEYAQDKIDAGLVNFGNLDERIKNQYDLIKGISLGGSTVVAEGVEAKQELMERLGEYLDFKEEKIDKAQSKYVRNQMIRGAVLGAGFSSAGYAIRHLFDLNVGSGKSIEEGITHKEHGTGVQESLGETQGKIEEGATTPLDKLIEEEINKAPVLEKPINLEIGNRGLEGAIIDYFRENPEIAVNKFGAPPELINDKLGDIADVDAFDKWAGSEAHKLWLDSAKEALENPENLEKLKSLGYSQDMEGYLKMMSRIGKGAVEIDSNNGKISLVDAEYLKAKIPIEVGEKASSSSNISDETFKASEVSDKSFEAGEIADKSFKADEISDETFKADEIPSNTFVADEILDKPFKADEIINEVSKNDNWKEFNNIHYRGDEEFGNKFLNSGKNILDFSEYLKVPKSYYISSDRAVELATENASRSPDFYKTIKEIMGDDSSSYENIKDFKIGMFLNKDNPQWRKIEEIFNREHTQSIENFGMEKLIDKIEIIFRNNRQELEEMNGMDFSLDLFLRTHIKELNWEVAGGNAVYEEHK